MRHPRFRSLWSIFFLLPVVLGLGGCATILRGTSERVTISTEPPGGRIIYRGQRVVDGGTIQVQKGFDVPTVDAGAPGAPRIVAMTYNPDPLVIVDVALLFFGLLPGAIALGVDWFSGAWRDLDDRQIFSVIGEDSSG
jgi:hypothetical protein